MRILVSLVQFYRNHQAIFATPAAIARTAPAKPVAPILSARPGKTGLLPTYPVKDVGMMVLLKLLLVGNGVGDTKAARAVNAAHVPVGGG